MGTRWLNQLTAAQIQSTLTFAAGGLRALHEADFWLG
jgi:hypothetical protein